MMQREMMEIEMRVFNVLMHVGCAWMVVYIVWDSPFTMGLCVIQLKQACTQA